MSLLLDALKRTDSDSDAGVEPETSEPQEEPLDGPATLALLVSKQNAQTPLSLVPASGTAVLPPASAAEQFSPGLVEPEPSFPDASLAASGPAGVALPEPVVEMARTVPTPERVASVTPARTAAAAPAPSPAPAAPANTRASISAPTVKPRAKTYALACAALAALAGIGIVGKSLWWPSTNAVIYPVVSEVQQTPPDAVQPTTTPSIAAVQVPSARPPDQFADAGYAPEIDLRSTDAPADANVRLHAPSAESALPPASATRQARGTAARASTATLSVERSEGPSPIDRHVQAGYLALGGGDAASAQTEYFAALALDPNNVDALMGAATVAARSGRPKDAAAAYAKVLKLEPGNPDATAAMASLGANGSAGENEESRLKILIASGDGGRPALHAALAGVYAADLRWSEAAQEYFTALAKDPGNPDLAFNVAASLDQNRNPGMALAYYGQALIFARQRPTQIDLNAIEQRMSQLQAHVGRSPAPETP
jgi:Flp pilus assembly protein TadD